MVSARTILGALGFVQLFAVVMNFWSPMLWYMLPIALFATLILWISIYYNWKRGVELSIFLSGVLFIMAACPLLSVIIHKKAAEKWHDVMWYSIEILAELLCIAGSIWVLYHTDYAQKPEKKGLLDKAKGAAAYVRESSGSFIGRRDSKDLGGDASSQPTTPGFLAAARNSLPASPFGGKKGEPKATSWV